MNIKPFMVPAGGKGFRLSKQSTDSTRGVKDREQGERELTAGTTRLQTLQDKLYAHDQYGVLLIF